MQDLSDSIAKFPNCAIPFVSDWMRFSDIFPWLWIWGFTKGGICWRGGADAVQPYLYPWASAEQQQTLVDYSRKLAWFYFLPLKRLISIAPWPLFFRSQESYDVIRNVADCLQGNPNIAPELIFRLSCSVKWLRKINSELASKPLRQGMDVCHQFLAIWTDEPPPEIFGLLP